MKLSRRHHVAVICSDYPRSLEFYTKTLKAALEKRGLAARVLMPGDGETLDFP